MRPPARPNSYFYHPLDDVLSTPARVRILRMLSLQPDPLPPMLIAARCRLGRAGTARALARLVATGIVEPTGGRPPRFPRYQLAATLPLAVALRHLFEQERVLGSAARGQARRRPGRA